MSQIENPPEEEFYDPEAAANDSMGYRHMVFRDSVTPNFPPKDEKASTTLYVMPAYMHPIRPGSTDWYFSRYAPDHPHAGKFTNWIRPYHLYEFVGKAVSIINPMTYDPSRKVNPVETLLKAVKSNPGWRHLAGLGEDGKQRKDVSREEVLKDTMIKPSVTRFAMNAVCSSNLTPGAVGESGLWSVQKGAIQPNFRNKEEAEKMAMWGLFPYLNLKARAVSQEDLASSGGWCKAYYWGDITDPRALIPCVIDRRPGSANTTVKMYHMAPPQNAQPLAAPTVNGTVPWLTSRIPLTIRDLFIDYDDAVVIDTLCSLFGEYPAILAKAFESTVPNFRENYLKHAGVVSESRVHQAGYREDPVAPAPTSSYAPPPGAALPPPPAGSAPSATPPPPATPPAAKRKFWGFIANATAEVSEDQLQAIVDRGENPPVMAYDQSGGWKTPADFGIKPTPPPPAPVAPPPPPASAATLPPPPTTPPAPTVQTSPAVQEPPTAAVVPPQPAVPPASVPTGAPVPPAQETPPPPTSGTASQSTNAASLAAQLTSQLQAGGPGHWPPATGSSSLPPPPAGAQPG